MILLTTTIFDIDIVQLLSWGIAILTTLLAIYFNRKASPLDIIETRNTFLEDRVNDLETKEERCRVESEEKTVQVSNLKREKEECSSELIKVKAVLERCNLDLESMKTQVLESQISVRLMQTQRDQIRKRFNIPYRISDIKRDGK